MFKLRAIFAIGTLYSILFLMDVTQIKKIFYITNNLGRRRNTKMPLRFAVFKTGSEILFVLGNCNIWVEQKILVIKWDEMRQNFTKTESLGPRKTSLNTVNFC
jgi:hypothetical protein